MVRIAFFAFSSLLPTPMLPDVSSRNAKDTGALSSRSNVSTSTRVSPTLSWKSCFCSPSANLPFLSVTSTGSITYSAPALSEKVGGSSGFWAAAMAGREEEREEENALHRQIIRPPAPPGFPPAPCRLSSLDDARPVDRSREAPQRFQHRFGGARREEFRPPDLRRRGARGRCPIADSARLAVGSRRPARRDHPSPEPRRGGGRVPGRRHDVFDAGPRARRLLELAELPGFLAEAGRGPGRLRLRPRAERPDRGRAGPRLRLPAAADRSGLSRR